MLSLVDLPQYTALIVAKPTVLKPRSGLQRRRTRPGVRRRGFDPPRHSRAYVGNVWSETLREGGRRVEEEVLVAGSQDESQPQRFSDSGDLAVENRTLESGTFSGLVLNILLALLRYNGRPRGHHAVEKCDRGTTMCGRPIMDLPE